MVDAPRPQIPAAVPPEEHRIARRGVGQARRRQPVQAARLGHWVAAVGVDEQHTGAGPPGSHPGGIVAHLVGAVEDGAGEQGWQVEGEIGHSGGPLRT